MPILHCIRDKPDTKTRIIEVAEPGEETLYFVQYWSDGWFFSLFGKGWKHMFESSSTLDPIGEYASPHGFKTKEEAEKELQIMRSETEVSVVS